MGRWPEVGTNCLQQAGSEQAQCLCRTEGAARSLPQATSPHTGLRTGGAPMRKFHVQHRQSQ